MKPKATLRSFLALASSSLLAMSSAHATSLYWSADGATQGCRCRHLEYFHLQLGRCCFGSVLLSMEQRG